MFSEPRINVIASDEGFSVEVLGRTGLLYTEGSKSMFIDSEVLNAGEIAVVKKSISAWKPPHDREIIDDNKHDAILDNIRRAFRFRKTSIDVW